MHIIRFGRVFDERLRDPKTVDNFLITLLTGSGQAVSDHCEMIIPANINLISRVSWINI
jgi:hypothetical protein